MVADQTTWVPIRVPLSIPLLVFSQCLIPFTMSLHSTSQKQFIFIFIFLLHIYLVTRTTTGHAGADFGIGGALMAQLFLASDWLIISQPEIDFRHNREVKAIGFQPYEFWTRFKWAWSLFLNRRGIGWNFQVPNLPGQAPPTMSRTRFVVSKIPQLCLSYIITDAVQNYNRYSPTFRPDSPIPSVASHGFPWTFINIASVGLAAVHVFQFQHTLVAMICVATGISRPCQWPDMFGSVSEAYTLRRFWNRTWHQMFQRSFRSHGQFVSRKVLRFSRDSWANAYTQLCVGFLVSTTVHHYADYMMNPAQGGGSSKFFLMQPLGIFVEERVIAIGQSLGWDKKATWVWRLVGYIWVMSWFSVVTVGWVDGQVRAGVNDKPVLPLSLIHGLWRGQWIIQ